MPDDKLEDIAKTPIDIQVFKELLLPVNINSEKPEYYPAFYHKCEALYKEREVVIDRIFDKMELLEDNMVCQVLFVDTQHEIFKGIRENLTYWQTKAERQFSFDIIRSIEDVLLEFDHLDPVIMKILTCEELTEPQLTNGQLYLA